MRNFIKQAIKKRKVCKGERLKSRNHTRVYLSGAVTGIYEPCRLFNAAFRYALLTFGSGTRVLNPLKLCRSNWSWLRCMVKCLWVLRTCDVIVMLPNWKYSRGAKIERKVAFYLGIKIMYAPAAKSAATIIEQDNDITGFPI